MGRYWLSKSPFGLSFHNLGASARWHGRKGEGHGVVVQRGKGGGSTLGPPCCSLDGELVGVPLEASCGSLYVRVCRFKEIVERVSLVTKRSQLYCQHLCSHDLNTQARVKLQANEQGPVHAEQRKR